MEISGAGLNEVTLLRAKDEGQRIRKFSFELFHNGANHARFAPLP
jgi:hypothetical protein